MASTSCGWCLPMWLARTGGEMVYLVVKTCMCLWVGVVFQELKVGGGVHIQVCFEMMAVRVLRYSRGVLYLWVVCVYAGETR